MPRPISSFGLVRLAVFLLAGLSLALPARPAVLDLTLYNSNPLLDSDGVTPLFGGQFGGDFVQLLRAGTNNSVDAPNLFGQPGGDDTLLVSTYVGAGTIGNDSGGLFVQASLFLPDSLVGTRVYARFWNNWQPYQATHYGNSALFLLPAPDSFGMALLDIAPSESSFRVASIPFEALPAVPEPATGLLIGLAVAVFALRRRHAILLRQCPSPVHPGFSTRSRGDSLGV